jgi:23S rRNA pseudouridine1911/1915/1917 synthase
MDRFTFTAESKDENSRVDHYLNAKLDGVSRTRIQKLIKDGFVTVNGEEIKANYRVRNGDEIEAIIPDAREFHLEPENIPLNIMYEDEHLLVINKPAGLVVHPAIGNYTGTLLNGLLYHLKNNPRKSLIDRPGLVHRLDKETSGLLIAAKNEKTLNYMQEELKQRRIKREYRTLVWGHVKEIEGRIELPIGRSDNDRRKMTVRMTNARNAITKYSLNTRYKFIDYLNVSLQTGRTHQIRVHFSHLGHPVVGDREYGGDEKVLGGLFDLYRNEAKTILQIMPRQSLHAYKLKFKHPETGLVHTIKSDLPEDMQKIINYLLEIESLG